MVALGDQTDFLTAMDAEFFLRWQAGKQAKPWFLGVSLHNPHDICHHVMEKGLEYANKDTFPPLPSNFEADPNEPEALKLRRQNTRYGHELAETKDWDEARWREYLHAYAHMVTQVDRAVGQVLRALKAGGWKDNTLVIFTSDHGEGVAAHRWATKLSLYEECTAVPLMVSYPGRIKPGVSTALASGLDLMPTICDYAGARQPELPGISLRPAMVGAEDVDGRFVVCELAADKDRPEIQGRMVRTKRYKYCAYAPGDRSEQLFDLQEDPGETTNLAAEPRFAENLRHCRRLLSNWAKTTDDPFAIPH
jgi:arylsulfatase A-like enzyme